MAAFNANEFASQLGQGVSVWQAKRMMWNTFNFGSANTIDSTQFSLEVGQYETLLGKSIGELAGESRSQHKSQGFGVSRQRGESREFFTTIKGEAPKTSLMDGVNTTWSRLEGGKEIDAMLNEVIAKYDINNPAASVRGLRKVVARLQALPTSVWKQVKMDELQTVILHCAGIYTEATVSQPGIIPFDTTTVSLSIISRSDIPVTMKKVMIGDEAFVYNSDLRNNSLFRKDAKMVFNNGVMETQPYWLREPMETGSFNVKDQRMIGRAENTPLTASFYIMIDSIEMQVSQPIQYRYVDPVKAEQYQPAYITSQFALFSSPGIILFKNGQKDSATLQINVSGLKKAEAASALVSITSAGGFYNQNFQKGRVIWNGGDVYTMQTKIPNYLIGKKQQTDALDFSFKPGGSFGDAEFFNAKRSIEYDHIPTQTWHYRDEVKVLNLDLKTDGKRIGYLPGAGDKVMASLVQMGYEVTELKAEDLKYNKLKGFDAVITGVRAYNVHDYLANAYDDLMMYVKNGGNLVVQYNTNNFISQLKGRIAPYSFSLGRTRITDENSKVNMLLPNHPVFNYPNKISMSDFDGWVQERSIYHAEGLDATQWQLPLGLTDPGESEQIGSLAIAPYGKGNFVYTGLVFFRELPAGVPGAYRLLANILALPRH